MTALSRELSAADCLSVIAGTVVLSGVPPRAGYCAVGCSVENLSTIVASPMQAVVSGSDATITNDYSAFLLTEAAVPYATIANAGTIDLRPETSCQTLGSVDSYLSHRIVAARVMTAR
jgi:hypothetical protein